MTATEKRRALADPASQPPHVDSSQPIGFTGLLDTLSYTEGEQLGVSWRPVGGQFTSAIIEPGWAGAFINALPEGDIWFGVNPTNAPAGIGVRRGGAEQVTRLAAVFADLDVKPGGCSSLEVAHQIIDALSSLLGTRPAVIVNSGHGLQPYWPIEPEDGGPLNTPERQGKAAALLRRWGRLVKLVAQNHGADADNVFDLPRILRVPGTFNHKSEPVPVTAITGSGGPVTVAALGELLDDQGVDERNTDHEITTTSTVAVSDPNGWGYTEQPCRYARQVITGWTRDNPTARHPWLLAQATRIAAMHRRGCLTQAGHREAIEALAKRFRELCDRPGDPRAVKRFEVAEAVDFGRQRAARMTEVHLLGEVGGHMHLTDAPSPAIAPAGGAPAADTDAKSTPAPAVGPAKPALRMVCADGVADTVPEWVWAHGGQGRILNAAITLFGGRPEAGKSTAARWFAAGWTTGTLTGCWEGRPVNVAYIATEEAWHHTVKPSLRAAGADLKRVFFIAGSDSDDPARINSIDDEAALTELFINNNIRAVFLDPLMGTINGGADINRNNEVRDYLDPWVRIAEKIDGPVVGICHLTKAPTGDLVASITGSSAFGELARCVFAFAIDREADDGTRIMSQAKNSAGHCDLNLSYKIGSHRVTTSDGKAADMARFELIGPTDKTVRELLIAERSTHANSGTDDCTKWLKGYLTHHGRSLREDVMTAATEMDFSLKMLRTAARKLGVHTERTREVPSRTSWALPGAAG